MGVGDSLCLLPPHSESPVPTIFIEVQGEGAERGKGGLAPAPRGPGAELVGAERGTGKETGWEAMPAWTEGHRAS